MCKTVVLGAALVSMRAFVISQILLFINLFSSVIYTNYTKSRVEGNVQFGIEGNVQFGTEGNIHNCVCMDYACT
jgi:hypothetical protein